MLTYLRVLAIEIRVRIIETVDFLISSLLTEELTDADFCDIWIELLGYVTLTSEV